MKVKVLRSYIDKETGQYRTAGDIVEVSNARFEEISKAGNYVREYGNRTVKGAPVEQDADRDEVVEDTQAVEQDADRVAFDDMKVAELREYAKEHDIDLTGIRSKAEIIEAIETAEE